MSAADSELPDERAPRQALQVPREGNLIQRGASGAAIARMAQSHELSAPERRRMRLILPDEAAGGIADAFREVRTRLLTLGGSNNFVTMVVPVSPHEGGSFVARNLAAAFAFDEAKTALLIDCNFRRPAQHLAFGITVDHGGLIDCLEHPGADLGKYLYETGIPRLRLLPTGQAREMNGEYYSSIHMQMVIRFLHKRYPDRYLFLDGPAIKGSPDARILSDLADFIVVVAAYGRDTAATINQAVAGFDPNKLAGVVFNNVR
ncbi:MAG: polysaccharide biosynthesis protein [Rudaea sp.]|uniref:polysaccharide biosynthesis protein n=1 Tax=Rudaea sp. TaxID=2136325 RepID=UPI0039E62E39